MLNPSLRAEHNVTVLDVVMPTTSECFQTSYDMLMKLPDESEPASGFGLHLLLKVKQMVLSIPQIKTLMQDKETDETLRKAFTVLQIPANWIIHNVIGYDVLVANWMLNLFQGQGYLFNVYTKDVFDISRADSSIAIINSNQTCGTTEFCELPSDEPAYASFASPFVRTVVSFFQPTTYVVSLLPLFWQQTVILLSTMFLFFTTSTLVSFTLKETQERMLRFTYLLQYHIREGLSVTKLVCTHLIQSLVFVPIMVGIMGFLYEFFGDSMLTFLLLSMLWVCECYTVVW